MRRVVAVAAVVVAAGLAGRAAAEPVEVAGQTWQHAALPELDRFSRDDGTVIEVQPGSLPCAQQLRTAEAPRYDWLAPTYWPVLDTSGGLLTACIERLAGGPAIVTVRPGQGKTAGADVAPILAQVADLVRPPVASGVIGDLRTSLPVIVVQATSIAFSLGGDDGAVVSLSPSDHGSCAYEHALSTNKLGQVTSPAQLADGYWNTTITTDQDIVIGCVDVREGYVTVTMSPATKLDRVADVLAEVRRAAYRTFGEPVTNATDPMVLPHTQQQLSAKTGSGAWKAVDGERFKLPGGDVLVTTFGLGIGHTLFSIGVSEGPCATGTTPADPAVAARLFPPQLGAVWMDPDPYKLRWKAWACVAQGGVTATVEVLSPIAWSEPPTVDDSYSLKAMTSAIARSYGIDVPADVPVINGGGGGGGGGGDRSSSKKALVLAGAYVGVLSFQPEDGDSRRGGLVGVTMRVPHPVPRR